MHLVKEQQHKFEKQVMIMLPFSSVVFLRSSGSMCTSCRMRGRRVMMPVPRGRMSLPTRLSKTELFPLLCREKSINVVNKDTSGGCSMHESFVDWTNQSDQHATELNRRIITHWHGVLQHL